MLCGVRRGVYPIVATGRSFGKTVASHGVLHEQVDNPDAVAHGEATVALKRVPIVLKPYLFT
jgi:hypothetical protein